MYPKLLNISKDEFREILNGWSPDNRLGTVGEVAGAVELLLSK